MEICVLGFGNVGGRLASLWQQAGHSIRIGLRPDSKSAPQASAQGLRALSPPQAIEGAQVVALALPWTAVEPTLRALSIPADTIILDATNPLSSELRVLVPPAGSGARQVAQWTGSARVVKAFNTIGAAYFGDPRFDSFYCGDDERAKAVVRKLIEDTTAHPVDLGALEVAGYLEQIAGLWVHLAVGGHIKGSFGFNLIK